MPVPVLLVVYCCCRSAIRQVAIDPHAIAADFPILDPPPRKTGLGQLFVGAVKGVGQVRALYMSHTSCSIAHLLSSLTHTPPSLTQGLGGALERLSIKPSRSSMQYEPTGHTPGSAAAGAQGAGQLYEPSPAAAAAAAAGHVQFMAKATPPTPTPSRFAASAQLPPGSPAWPPGSPLRGGSGAVEVSGGAADGGVVGPGMSREEEEEGVPLLPRPSQLSRQ